MHVLNRLFPRQIDNTYRGHTLAIWLLALVALGKAIQGTESILNTRSVFENADGLSLDRFDPMGGALVLSLFALLGLYLLIVPALSALALIRYRAMIPLMYLMLLLLYGASRLVQLLHPVPRTDAHPVGYYVNLVLLGLMLVGFVLSLLNRPAVQGATSP